MIVGGNILKNHNKFLKLEKNEFDSFRIFHYGKDEILRNLAIIFDDPLGLSFVHNFIYEKDIEVSCNIFTLELTDKNTIIITSHLSDDMENPDTVEIDKDILFDFIQRYRAMENKNPDELIITREGDNYIIEGKFTDGTNLIM
jgi:hypothetical protein